MIVSLKPSFFVKMGVEYLTIPLDLRCLGECKRLFLFITILMSLFLFVNFFMLKSVNFYCIKQGVYEKVNLKVQLYGYHKKKYTIQS